MNIKRNQQQQQILSQLQISHVVNAKCSLQVLGENLWKFYLQQLFS